MKTLLLALALSLAGCAVVPPPKGFIEYCRTPGRTACEPQVAQPKATRTLEELRAVNQAVNSSVRAVDDRVKYGVDERWAIATDSGDCEDFALRKLEELTARGWPLDDIRLAVVSVKTFDGLLFDHAVLVVRLDRADYVLDNLSPDVWRIEQTRLLFQKIQERGGSQTWVSVR